MEEVRASILRGQTPSSNPRSTFLNLRHAQKYATRQARLAAGELYPGPVLMPKGLLRALDPVLALTAGPARLNSPEFVASFEATLRGRPDGPLLLALWSSIAGGEINHQDLRDLVRLMPTPPPVFPETKEDVLQWVRPRAGAMARCILSLSQKGEQTAVKSMEDLACGLVLVRWITDLPTHLSQGVCYLPQQDLNATGANVKDLHQGIVTPEIALYLRTMAQWAQELLLAGMPVCNEVGARLARGLRATVLRSLFLLEQVQDLQKDFFRHPPALSSWQRWQCAVRAWWPVRP